MARGRETIHILLVEASATSVTIIQEALESGYIPVKLTVAQNLAEAHACLSESLPHLVIIDLLLPDGNGVELLPTQKKKLAYPIVIMCSQGDEQAAVEAMKAGAVDYVVKSSTALAEMPRIAERALREWRHITERKQSYEALQESEERFRSFFDSAASGMAIIDLEGRAMRANPTFCRLSGYSEAETLEMNILEVTHPDDREITRQLYDEIRMGRRQVVDYEKRYLCKDGSVIWGHATVAGVFGSDGALRYFAANVHNITESKRVQNQIRESKQMLQLVLDYIPQHVFWKDRDSVFLGCNRNFARAAGVERPQDLIGKSDYDLAWKREEADFYRKCDRRVMEADAPELHIIEPQLQADGKQAWLDTNKVPLHDAEGNVVGILGSFEDITERKRAEEELRTAHRQMQDIIEFLPDATFVIDRNKQVVAWNRAMEEKTGVHKEDILGQGDYAYAVALYRTRQPILIDLIGCSDPENVTQYNFVEKKGETLFAERFMPTLYGGKGAHVWIKASPLHDPEGNLVGAIESIRDITDRKLAEENLRTVHRQMRDIIEFLPDATFVIDRDRKVVAWNRAMEKMSGVGKKEMIGQGDYAYAIPFYGKRRPILIDLIASPELEKKVQYDSLGNRGETKFVEQYLPFLYQGKGAYAWATASRLLDQEGNFAGAIESVRDITDRKEAEKKLKEANRELDAFVYTVSHDLRSPLTPIIGFAQHLKATYKERLDEEAMDCLTAIETQGDKMVALMEDLLSLAKVGHLERPAEAVDPNEVVQEVIDSMENLPASRGGAVKMESMPELFVPKTLLTQIFNNLVGNAIRYADTEAGSIEVGGERSGARVGFYVRDHGPGIMAEERSRIFDVFYRGSVGKKIQGTGVGLAIVQKIARLYGGKTWVEETPGGGSTFLVEMVDTPTTTEEEKSTIEENRRREVVS